LVADLIDVFFCQVKAVLVGERKRIVIAAQYVIFAQMNSLPILDFGFFPVLSLTV